MKIDWNTVGLAFTQFNWQTGNFSQCLLLCLIKFQQDCSYTGHIWWDISNQLVWLSHDLIDRGGRASHCGNLVIVGAQLRSQSCEGGTASMPPGLNGVPEGHQKGTREVPGRVVSLSPDDFGLFSIFKYFKLNVPRVEYKIQNYRESIVRFLKGSFIVNVCDALCLRWHITQKHFLTIIGAKIIVEPQWKSCGELPKLSSSSQNPLWRDHSLSSLLSKERITGHINPILTGVLAEPILAFSDIDDNFLGWFLQLCLNSVLKPHLPPASLNLTAIDTVWKLGWKRMHHTIKWVCHQGAVTLA